MDYSKRLSISYYKTIATLNEPHKIYLVQHQETQKIYVKKVLDVYNKDVYLHLYRTHTKGSPRIIDLYEEDHQLTVIEDYISGSSLQEVIDASVSGKANILNETTIYYYMMELCSILEGLHSLQPPVIHRDIKPSNIIITEHNHVILLDFNAAKHFTNTTSTDTVLLGTQGYAAPEQYGFGSSTPCTDIYALGILLKELTSALPVLSNKYDSIIAKCIQINPKDRFQSVTELKAALRYLAPSVAPTSTNTRPERSATYNPYLPPGFRNKTPWKIFVASVSYLFIFWLSFSLEVENVSTAGLWFERFFCLFMMLSFVCVGTNYLDIQRILPLCKHKNRMINYIGIVILEALLLLALLIILTIVMNLFFL